MRTKKDANLAIAESKPIWAGLSCYPVKPLAHISEEAWKAMEEKELEAFMAGTIESPAEKHARARAAFEKSLAREDATEQLQALDNERAFLRKQLQALESNASPGKARKGNQGRHAPLSIAGKSLRETLTDMFAQGHDREGLVSFAYRTLKSARHDERLANMEPKKAEAWLKGLSRRHADVAIDVAKHGKRTDVPKSKGRKGKAIEITGEQIKAVLSKPLAGHIELGMDIETYAKAHAIIKEYKAQGIIA